MNIKSRFLIVNTRKVTKEAAHQSETPAALLCPADPEAFGGAWIPSGGMDPIRRWILLSKEQAGDAGFLILMVAGWNQSALLGSRDVC